MPGSTWEAVQYIGTQHSVSMWEYALQATGLNLKLEEDTDISSLFIPLDDFTLQCHSAGEEGICALWASARQRT